jgi:hypothetical protein
MNLNKVFVAFVMLAAVSVTALASGSPALHISAARIGIRVQQGNEEGDAYKAWYEANAANDVEKAYPMAKAFVEKYPNNQYTKYLKETWIPSAKSALFNNALKAKNVPDMIKWGNDALTDDPNQVDFLYFLAVYIYTYEVGAQTAVYDHASEDVGYIQRLIKQVEAGKVPAAVKDGFNKDKFLATLYLRQAVIDQHNNDNEKALADYQQASKLDPKTAVYYLQAGFIIYNNQYKAARAKYEALPEADRNAAEPKPEVKAAEDAFNKQTDALIEIWAHYLAFVGNDDATNRDQIHKVVADLYKYRHPDAPDGLQKLIDQYKSAPAAPVA